MLDRYIAIIVFYDIHLVFYCKYDICYICFICSTYLVFHNPSHSMASTRVPNSSGSCGHGCDWNSSPPQNRTYLRSIRLHIYAYIYIYIYMIYIVENTVSMLYMHVCIYIYKYILFSLSKAIAWYRSDAHWSSWWELTQGRRECHKNPMAFDGGWFLRYCIWWYILLWQAWKPLCFQVFVQIFVDSCLA